MDKDINNSESDKPSKPNSDEKSGNTLQSLSPYLTLGIQLAITVIVFFFLGKYLDEKFETTPWLMITMIFVGSVGGMIKFFQTVTELSKKHDAQQ